MELIHLHLVKEYIVRLSKRRVVLKTGEQQQQLAGHILANADDIQRFCTQHVSPAPRRLRAPPSPASAGQNLCGPQAPFGAGQPPSNQACACRGPQRPGCIEPSPRLPRSFACKTPVPSRSKWPLMPPATPTSGEDGAPQDLGSQHGVAGPALWPEPLPSGRGPDAGHGGTVPAAC